jgi:hypothetical protein
MKIIRNIENINIVKYFTDNDNVIINENESIIYPVSCRLVQDYLTGGGEIQAAD